MACGGEQEGAAEEGLLRVSAASCAAATDEEPQEEQGRERGMFRRPRAAALALGVTLVVCAALGLCSVGPSPHRHSSRMGHRLLGLTGTGTLAELIKTVREGVEALDNMAQEANSSWHGMKSMAKSFQDSTVSLANTSAELFNQMNQHNKWQRMIRKKLASLNETQKAAFKEKIKAKMGITNWNHLRPKANLTDGKPCPQNEEWHGALCYSKCSDLTGGKYPFRISAWTCCSHEPPCIDPNTMTTKMTVCGGYSTSSAVDKCPHSAGSCLLNEELFAGQCYKSCALISFGVLPVRSGPSSCCRSKDQQEKPWLRFLDFDGCDTDLGTYAIGGGRGFSERDPVEVHRPFVQFVES